MKHFQQIKLREDEAIRHRQLPYPTTIQLYGYGKWTLDSTLRNAEALRRNDDYRNVILDTKTAKNHAVLLFYI